jgi:hypothetical protein
MDNSFEIDPNLPPDTVIVLVFANWTLRNLELPLDLAYSISVI